MTDPTPTPPPAGLLRRFAALIYDALLLVGLWLIATALFLPFNSGEAVGWTTTPGLFVLHKIVVLAVLVGFYGIFWTRQGHTLGMASWRLEVLRLDGARLTWRDVVQRIAAATLSWLPLGLGWWWSLFDARKRTWHDILSRTEVRVVPRRAKSRAG